MNKKYYELIKKVAKDHFKNKIYLDSVSTESFKFLYLLLLYSNGKYMFDVKMYSLRKWVKKNKNGKGYYDLCEFYKFELFLLRVFLYYKDNNNLDVNSEKEVEKEFKKINRLTYDFM